MKEKAYKTVVRPATLFGADDNEMTGSTARGEWDEDTEVDVRSDKEG